MNPLIVVILLTRATEATPERTDYALRTVRAFLANARYPDLAWYIADGGSPEPHRAALREALAGQVVIGEHHDLGNYGADANKAWHIAHEHADLTFFLEDDWELSQELQLAPYAELLDQLPNYGMVRLGYLNLNMRGHVFGHGGHLYWDLERDADSYVFTGHPSLRHRRFREFYGAYPEGLDPGKSELGYAEKYRYAAGGPGVVWPVANSEYGPFGHIGAVKSYT